MSYIWINNSLISYQ